MRVAQPGARHLDGAGQRIDGFLLAEDHGPEVAIQVLQRVAFIAGDRLGRYPRDLGDDVLDFAGSDHLLLFRFGLDALRRAGLVDHVDRLVGQVAVVDVAGGEFGRSGQGAERVFDPVVRLETRFQAAQDGHRLFHAGFLHVDLLESPRQRVILLEHAAVLVVGGCADAAQQACGQRRFQQVGGIQGATRRGTRSDHGMDFVDEQNGVRRTGELFDHRLEALLEIAAILGPGQQGPHVQGEDDSFLQDVGHAALDDTPRQALGDGGFADTGLADQERIVFTASAERLDHALDFHLAPDQRVDLAGLGLGIEIDGEGIERGSRAGFSFLLLRACFRAPARAGVRGGLGDAMGDEVHHVQTAEPLLREEMQCVRVFFAEDGHQHIGAGHLFLS